MEKDKKMNADDLYLKKLLDLQLNLCHLKDTSKDVKYTLSQILEMILELDELDGGGIYLYDEKEDSFDLKVSKGLSKEFTKKVSRFKKGTRQYDLIVKGEAVFMVYSHLGIKDEIRESEGLKAVGIIPIKIGDQYRAVFNIASRKCNEFSIYIKRTIELVSCQIDSILEKYNLYSKLGATQTKYEEIFDLSPEAIVILDKKGEILDVNKRLNDWLGYTKEETVGRGLLKLPFLTMKSKTIVMANFAKRMLGKKIPPYELEFISKKRESMIGRITATAIRDERGDIIADLVMISDVTNMRKMEREVQKTNDELQMIFDSIPVMVFYKDREHMILKVNKARADTLGLAIKDIEGKGTEELYPEEASKYIEDDNEVFKAGKPKREIIEQLSTPKGKIWVQTDKIPIKDEKGEVVGLIGVSADVTNLKKTEQTMSQEKNEVERLNRLMVGRELRIKELKDKIKELKQDINGERFTP
ncbi:MAG: PAS domain-containing protein [Candidatus Dojkabacteria bacterium]|nr:PAS domain-containing protein [Candidatus Dojkabacteria bacterium]